MSHTHQTVKVIQCHLGRPNHKIVGVMCLSQRRNSDFSRIRAKSGWIIISIIQNTNYRPQTNGTTSVNERSAHDSLWCGEKCWAHLWVKMMTRLFRNRPAQCMLHPCSEGVCWLCYVGAFCSSLREITANYYGYFDWQLLLYDNISILIGGARGV